MALNLPASPMGLSRDALRVLPHAPYLYLLMGLIIDINHLSSFVKSKLYDFLTFLSFYDVKFVLNRVKNKKLMKCLNEAYWKNPLRWTKRENVNFLAPRWYK
jgi:hypothetical protein